MPRYDLCPDTVLIGLMVDMTAPTLKDRICDPACGTAGFLVAVAIYLMTH
jgi:type I restriction enzyme M protein